jgi:hypothetical protein
MMWGIRIHPAGGGGPNMDPEWFERPYRDPDTQKWEELNPDPEWFVRLVQDPDPQNKLDPDPEGRNWIRIQNTLGGGGGGGFK